MLPLRLLPFAAFAAFPLSAQDLGFQSPGRSQYFQRLPQDQFTNQFNPAFGAVFDGFLDYRDIDGGDGGFDLQLRILELNVSGAIDPGAYGYVALVSENAEAPEIEEAAVVLDRLPGTAELKIGRFFVDFGKLMQTHVEELRTLERPLPLREYLGEELGGVGVQFDYWMPLNETTPVRFSVGAFSSLLGEGHHHEDEDEPEPEAEVADLKDFNDLSFTARLTGMTELGDNAILQAGASGRFVPNFSFAFDGLAEADLSNTVLGLDLTYQHTDDSGQKRFLLGGEYVAIDGDLSAEVDDPLAPTTLTVSNSTASGYYAFCDYGWNPRWSAGVQFARAEELEGGSDVEELDLYVTWASTELRRLRFGVTLADAEVDEQRAYLQFTNFFGAHFHATKW
ncbi:MAG: hypothetical protein WD226_09615 [Planctomycetota bacterium]